MVGRFFSRFREPKARFDVEVVSGDLFPGSTVEIRTMFQPQEQFQVSEAVIGLVCTERYWKSDLISGIAGNSSGEDQLSNELVKITESLLDSTELIPGADYRKYIEFKIPDDAPPTLQGDVADISWHVFAYVVPGKGVQIGRYQEIRVMGTPVGDEIMRDSGAIAEEGRFDRCELTLNVDSAVADLGGKLTGNFRLTSNQDTRLYWIMVDLECTENAGYKMKSPKDMTRFIFDKDMKFQEKESKEWPFEIRVPRNALASFSQSETEVTWVLRAGAEPRAGSRMTVSVPIKVFGGPPAQHEPS